MEPPRGAKKPRRVIVGGNWKCNLTQAQALELVEQLNGTDTADVEVVVAPVALHLPLALSGLKRAIAVSAQNCGFAGEGAYTGELAAEQLAGLNVQWVILGHSERRTHFFESDELLRKKLEHALTSGLRVIFCIGESKAEREAGETLAVCKRQLAAVLDLLDPAQVVLAYEPVWAIGTGLVATPQQAQETHAAIRAHLASSSAELAAEMRIQYGGSVSAANCAQLAALPDVDGFLVGGASIKGADFAAIVASCAGRSKAFGPFMADAIAYPVLLGAMLLPSLVRVHPYAQMLVLATLVVYVGCHRALAQLALSPGVSQAETVTRKEALQFPLVGSGVLVGLYLVVKLVKKEYLNALIAVYFLALGTGAVQQAVRGPLQSLHAVRRLKTHVWQIKWAFWDKNAVADKLEFNALDVPLLVLALLLSVSYARTKYWLLANALAVCFSLCALETLNLGSFQIGCILLALLFVYDVFWVFATEVMVTVAKGIDAPIKLLFPKDVLAEKVEFSLLGLGDIVIPGIFVAMMLRFDASRGLRHLPYFRANLLGYALGLLATVGVMHFFQAAQPALLYLVPACVGSAFAVAAVRGEVRLLWNFSLEAPAPAASASTAVEAKKAQ